jgi:hypothetical protein
MERAPRQKVLYALALVERTVRAVPVLTRHEDATDRASAVNLPRADLGCEPIIARRYAGDPCERNSERSTRRLRDEKCGCREDMPLDASPHQLRSIT